MMSPDEIIAVVQAYKDGKTIEIRITSAGAALDLAMRELPPSLQAELLSAEAAMPGSTRFDWSKKTGAVFNFGYYDYRIRPEPKKPREGWISPLWLADIPCTEHQDCAKVGFIFVREVIDEHDC